MDGKKLVCTKCGKENVARDFQCDCGNVLDVAFRLDVKPDVEKRRKRLEEEQKHKEEKDEAIDDITDNAIDDSSDVVGKENTEDIKDEDHEVIKDMEEEENTVIQPRPTYKLTKEQIAKCKIYRTGNKPGIGIYICIECNENLQLDGKRDKLPPCARCFSTKFIQEQ